MTPEIDLELESRLRPLEYQPSLKSIQNPEFPVSMRSEDLATRELKSFSHGLGVTHRDNTPLSNLIDLQTSGRGSN